MALPSASEDLLPGDGGLSGFSGFLSIAVGWFESELVGRGGGGLLGGMCFEDACLAGGFCFTTSSSSSLRVGSGEGFAPGTTIAEGGTKLLILFGGGGRRPFGVPLGVLSPSDTVLMPLRRTGLASTTSPFPAPPTSLALTDLVRGEAVFFTGGGGRGMLGGGGIIRLAGLLTIFIFAFILGGGTGVPVGVSIFLTLTAGFGLTVESAVLGLSAGLGVVLVGGAAAVAAAAASSRTWGAGGGGRRRGFVRLSMAVVRRLGCPGFLVEGLGTGGGTLEGLGAVGVSLVGSVGGASVGELTSPLF